MGDACKHSNENIGATIAIISNIGLHQHDIWLVKTNRIEMQLWRFRLFFLCEEKLAQNFDICEYMIWICRRNIFGRIELSNGCGYCVCASWVLSRCNFNVMFIVGSELIWRLWHTSISILFNILFLIYTPAPAKNTSSSPNRTYFIESNLCQKWRTFHTQSKINHLYWSTKKQIQEISFRTNTLIVNLKILPNKLYGRTYSLYPGIFVYTVHHSSCVYMCLCVFLLLVFRPTLQSKQKQIFAVFRLIVSVPSQRLLRTTCTSGKTTAKLWFVRVLAYIFSAIAHPTRRRKAKKY